MTTLVAPAPDQTAVLVKAGVHSPPWRTWFRELRARLLATPLLVVRRSYVDQAAALAAVAVVRAGVADLYRVTWQMHTTRASSIGSAWTVVLRWTDAGAACASSSATVSGNAVTDTATASVLVHADAGTAVTIETTYVSSGATAMQYRLDVVVEQMPVGP